MASPFSRNAFAAIDAATASPSLIWRHTSSRHAEAGYLDPSLGWIGIRAEASGGTLHAAIVPASAQAAEVLGSHLPALHAYVSQHHGQDSTIDMSWQNATNAGGGFQQSAQRDPHGSTENDNSMPGPTPASIAQPEAVSSLLNAGAPPPPSGARYISVLA